MRKLLVYIMNGRRLLDPKCFMHVTNFNVADWSAAL